MTTVFMGGSRHCKSLAPAVLERLANVARNNFAVIVGDADGADTAVQRYFASIGYTHLRVFHSGKNCRNNIGTWPQRQVDVNSASRGRQFFEAKDRAMTDEATHGLMIWDGVSAGTLANIRRLAALGKPTVVFLDDQGRFEEVRCATDVERIVSSDASQPPTLRTGIQRKRRAG